MIDETFIKAREIQKCLFDNLPIFSDKFREKLISMEFI